MAQEIEREFGLGEELIPEKVRERDRYSCEDCNKVSLEFSNGPFRSITAVDIWGDKLEVAIPFVLDIELVGFTSFVVQYLEVDFVAGIFEMIHDTVISGEAVAIVP